MNLQEKKETSVTEQELVTGFDLVKVVAINPDRAALDKILGITDRTEPGKEIEYTGEDADGNNKVRLSFVLQKSNGDFSFQNFTLVDKVRTNKEGNKNQVVNNVLQTSWTKEDGTFPQFFTHFLDNKTKTVLGKKVWRDALVGEEELVNFVRAWMGRVNFNVPEADLFLDTKRLLKGNVKELRDLVGHDLSTEFIGLFNVATVEKSDENGDPVIKQYQNIYKKAYLAKNFMEGIKNGGFSDDYKTKVFKKFVDGLGGDYPLKAAYTLKWSAPYVKSADIAASTETKATTAEDDDY